MSVNKASNLFIILITLVGLTSCGIKTHQPLPDEFCLGPVCFGDDIWKDAVPFLDTFGKGFAREGKFPGYWYETEEGTHVHISRYHGENRPIDYIMVSELPSDADHYAPPKRPFGNLVTESGIGLGASHTQVIEQYGKPAQVFRGANLRMQPIPKSWRDRYGSQLLLIRYIWDDVTPWLEFYFFKEKVVAIVLSTST